MPIEKTRAEVISSIWQAIAQSKVDLSFLSQEQQQELVNKIADNVMITINRQLEDFPEPKPESAVADVGEEEVLWKGRPFLSLTESYVLTDERIKIVRGLFSRDIENFELVRVQDIDLSQGMSERMLGIGDITVRGHDPSDPQVVLRNIDKPEVVYEILRKAWLAARKRHGLQFREYM